jgi:hypothetical protein
MTRRIGAGAIEESNSELTEGGPHAGSARDRFTEEVLLVTSLAELSQNAVFVSILSLAQPL